MLRYKRILLAGTVFTALALQGGVNPAWAEDCTGTLPGADCTLDENTTDELAIDNGVTLFVSGSISLDHDIDGSTLVGDGTISSAGGGNTITQNADIGSNIGIEQLTIDGDDIWVTSGAINTDNDGSDIDLGSGDGGEELHFLSGSSFVGEIDGHSGDIVNFGADGNGGDFQTISQIEGVSVVLTSGNLTFNSAVGSGVAIGDLTVNNGTTLTMNSSVTSTGALDVDGTVSIASGRTLSTDTYVVDGDAAEFRIGVARTSGTMDSGSIVVASGGPVDFSSDTFVIEVDDGSQILQDGTVLTIVSGNGGTTVLPSFTDTSYVYNFLLQQNGDNIDLVVAVRDIDDLTSSPNNNAIGTIIFEDFAESETSAINTVQSLLGNDSSRAAFNERLESLLPVLDGGYASASNAVVGQMQRAVYGRTNLDRHFQGERQKHLSRGEVVFASGKKNLRTGETKKHELASVDAYKADIWGQVFYEKGNQRNDDVDGHSRDTAGIVVGADMLDLDGDLLLGGAITIGSSTIDSDNSNSAKTDVDSLGFSFYGGKRIMRDALFSAVVSYVYNDNTTARYDVGGIAGNTARGKFKSEHISLKSAVSRYYALKNNMHIKPRVYAGYDYLSADQYRERGVSGLNLDVSYGSLNRLVTGVGADAGWFYELKNGALLSPGAHLSYEYAILADRLESDTIIDGEQFVVAGNDASRHTLNAGLNVQLQQNDYLHFDAGYALGLSEQQDNHALSAKMVYDF
ncbi:MAG: autotransporter domain-containing protein [Alphaproteobacteria bacterium]